MRGGSEEPIRGLKIDGPAGPLEALHRDAPGGEARGAALLCHPHPQYGGTLHSRVVFHLARAFHEAAHATLRFNFRGAGLSAGRFDGGEGELEDARAALEHLRRLHPGLPLVVAGHSFGSWVGLRLGVGDPDVDRLVGVGVPLSLYPFDFLEGTGKQVLLIQGEQDGFGGAAAVRDLAGRLDRGRAVILPGADHFLAGSEAALRKEIAADFA